MNASSQSTVPGMRPLCYVLQVFGPAFVLSLFGCHTVDVHPRLQQDGKGLECYKTVAITCDGHESQTLEARLTAACEALGYTVVEESPDLNLNVFVHESTQENTAGQIAMMYWFIFNFGVGDARVAADAQLVEASSNDVLLAFKSKRTGLTNYEATKAWVDDLTSAWSKYVGDRVEGVPD